ncbi:MAG: hypothetical protein ACMG6E_10795, partial [Candidatus Roizmanbacteria bacterium]
MDDGTSKLFWDGFQWVTRAQPVFDLLKNATDIATMAVTGEDQAKNDARVAASKTVIIEGVALDIGMTAKDIHKFLLDKLQALGEKEVEI